MSWFQLDPESAAARAKAAGTPARVPSLAQSIGRGAIGFTVVSAAGFLPWVLGGNWFPSELAMYVGCAAVFIVLSGVLLHPLIIGPDSLKRFYIFFGVAFAAYAAAWIAGYVGPRGHVSHTMQSLIGLFAGTFVMAVIFGVAFEARGAILKIALTLFVLNSVGYFVGGWIEGYLAHLKELNLVVITLSGPSLYAFMKILWGVCYGIGFGSGLGIAFYAAQEKTRALL